MVAAPPLSRKALAGSREWQHESRRCSKDTYPESCITKYTSIRRQSPDLLRHTSGQGLRAGIVFCVCTATLEAAQRQMDGLFSQLSYKCHLEEVSSMRYRLKICPELGSRVGLHTIGTKLQRRIPGRSGKGLQGYLAHKNRPLPGTLQQARV